MSESVTPSQPVGAVTGMGDRSLAKGTPSQVDSAQPKQVVAPAEPETPDVSVQLDTHARAFATYSKVHQDIANVVEDLGTQPARKNPIVLAQAENTLIALMPQPSVVLPLPPANEDMIAFVAGVTQSIVRQAQQATTAQAAALAPAVVDAATA